MAGKKRLKQEKRPWGRFKVLAFNEKCTVKILTIKKNEQLSLQKHKKRDELWHFFTKALVEIGNKKKKVRSGDEVFIEKGEKHRIIAENEVRLVEVSYGIFDEKDEERLEDKYGRK